MNAVPSPRHRARTVAQALMSASWHMLISAWPWRALGYLLVSAVLGIALLVLLPLTLPLLPLRAVLCGMLERGGCGCSVVARYDKTPHYRYGVLGKK